MAKRRLPLLRAVLLLLQLLLVGISAKAQEGHCFSLHLIKDGTTFDSPTLVTVVDKNDHQTLPERDGKYCLPATMAAETMLDLTFINGDDRFYLSRISIAAFDAPWDVEFGGKKYARLTDLPKSYDAKRSCKVTFHAGEPETAMITSPCRFPANTPTN